MTNIVPVASYLLDVIREEGIGIYACDIFPLRKLFMVIKSD